MELRKKNTVLNSKSSFLIHALLYDLRVHLRLNTIIRDFDFQKSMAPDIEVVSQKLRISENRLKVSVFSISYFYNA
jgi:hypothetical protein